MNNKHRKTLLIAIIMLIGVTGCDIFNNELMKNIVGDDVALDLKEATFLQNEFVLSIVTLHQRGAVLDIDYSGEVDLSLYEISVDIENNGVITQLDTPTEEIEGKLISEINGHLYLPGDELSFTLQINAEGTEIARLSYSLDYLGYYPSILAAPTTTVLPASTPWREVNGVIEGEQTWSDFILVTGDIYIPSKSKLIVMPGTVVHIMPHKDLTPSRFGHQLHNCPYPKSEIIIDGFFEAQGTPSEPITFTSHADNPEPGDWGGILLRDNAQPALLSYLIIEFADINIQIRNSSTIEYSIIRNAYGGLKDCPLAKHWDVRTGVDLFGNNAVARNNAIYNNTWGIHANQAHLSDPNRLITVEGNLLSNNNKTTPGYDVPNGVHICTANIEILGNDFVDNDWGIEIGLGTNVTIQANSFKYHPFAIVWYAEPGDQTCTAIICNNEFEKNERDYRKHPENIPLPDEWFGCP
jgi:hypothetical protein